MQPFFGKKNYLGIGIAVLLLIVGFLMLGLKPANNKVALNVAPFVLISTFLVILPWSILRKTDKEGQNSREGV
jgi:hypothetical protein